MIFSYVRCSVNLLTLAVIVYVMVRGCCGYEEDMDIVGKETIICACGLHDFDTGICIVNSG